MEKHLEYANDVIDGKVVACEAMRLACERYLNYLKRDDIIFSASRANRVINFCENLTLSTGKFARQKMKLTPWQKFVIYYVYGLLWKDSKKRITREVYLQLSRKSGKALSLDTPIPTPDGYTTMGDLKVGDYVIDENGNPTRVTFVTPVMTGHKCYEITFSDGEKITADAEHNWFVTRYHGEPHVETTEDIVKKGYNEYCVTVPIVKGGVKYIRSIVEVESVPVRCITVDSPNHLYVCGRKGTVTHNTALASALSLYHLVADGEENAEGVFAANSADQASLAFRQTLNYVSYLDPKKKLFKPYRNEIRFPLTKSQIKVVSADAKRLDGLNLSFFCLDEYHAAQNSDVYNVLASSQGMREQPMAIIITTAGFDLTGPCYEMYLKNKEILHGKIEDDSTAVFIFEPDEGDDPSDESTWEKSQPNINVTVPKSYIKKELTKCKMSATAETNFLTKILNMWCQSEFGDWIPSDYVLKCCKDVSLNDHQGELCEIGLDLSSVSDMTALSVLFSTDDKLTSKVFYFLPEIALKESTNREKYTNWRRSKELIITQGNVIDNDFIINKIQEINAVCPINTIWYDAWNSTAIIVKLTEMGFSCKPYSQTAGSINKPARELEKRVREGSIVIDNNAITKWQFHNVTIKEDYNGNIKPIKQNGNSEMKIDGVIATIMAIGGWLSIPRYDLGI